MLNCLIMLIVWVIVLLIVVYIIETLLSLWVALPPQILLAIRLLAALIVLIWALSCLGLVTGVHVGPLR